MLSDLIPLKEAIARLPKPYGKPVDLHTIQRWIRKGVGGTKLQARRIGGRWFTSDKWIEDFILARSQDTQEDIYALAADHLKRHQEAKDRLNRRRQQNGNGKGKVPVSSVQDGAIPRTRTR